MYRKYLKRKHQGKYLEFQDVKWRKSCDTIPCLLSSCEIMIGRADVLNEKCMQSVGEETKSSKL
jgi:hypothetical protein